LSVVRADVEGEGADVDMQQVVEDVTFGFGGHSCDAALSLARPVGGEIDNACGGRLDRVTKELAVVEAEAGAGEALRGGGFPETGGPDNPEGLTRCPEGFVTFPPNGLDLGGCV
jgi:hypothetical protein